MRVLGLDLSLTASGVALIDVAPPHEVAEPWIRVRTIGSKGKAKATLVERHNRLLQIAAALAAESHGVDLVTIERPAFAATTGQHHDRSGLWWLTLAKITGSFGVSPDRIVEISPASVKKFITGKGNADKDSVLLATARRFPTVPISNNNESDALVLALMGARILGRPIDGVPKAQAAVCDPLLIGGAA